MSRARRTLVRAAIALAVSLLLVEVAFRALIFWDLPGARRLSLVLRQPQHYYAASDPNYWTCAALLRRVENLRPVPNHDALTGWAGFRIEPGTYEHRNEGQLAGRRPVLLYGDSFAECVTPWEECWGGLLQRSELGGTHALLNYGVGGFGIDQTWLMFRESIDRFADQDPLVVFSLLVEDDLDRVILPFRGWPKPRLHVEDGRLIDPEPIPDGLAPFVADHAPRPWSWAWRYLVHGTDILPAWFREDAAAEEARRAEIRAITRAILVALREELDARGLEGFVLVFHGPASLDAQSAGAIWQEQFLIETLQEVGLPYVLSRRALIRHFGQTATPVEHYLIQTGPGAGHYTPLGNEAVFGALLDGIQERYHGP